MQLKPVLRGARNKIVPICVMAILLGIAGCRGFFVPECQEYNDCTSGTHDWHNGHDKYDQLDWNHQHDFKHGHNQHHSDDRNNGYNRDYRYHRDNWDNDEHDFHYQHDWNYDQYNQHYWHQPNHSQRCQILICLRLECQHRHHWRLRCCFRECQQCRSSTINAPGSPTAIAAVPSGKFLYLATSDGAVYLNTIASNGNLQPGNHGDPVANVTQPTWMSMDRTGKWLFVGSSIANDVQEFQIDAATGALHAAAQSPALDPGNPAEVYVTPDNQELFVALGKGGVDAFPFDAATGAVGTRQHIAPLHSGSADNVLTSDSNFKKSVCERSEHGNWSIFNWRRRHPAGDCWFTFRLIQ